MHTSRNIKVASTERETQYLVSIVLLEGKVTSCAFFGQCVLRILIDVDAGAFTVTESSLIQS